MHKPRQWWRWWWWRWLIVIITAYAGQSQVHVRYFDAFHDVRYACIQNRYHSTGWSHALALALALMQTAQSWLSMEITGYTRLVFVHLVTSSQVHSQQCKDTDKKEHRRSKNRSEMYLCDCEFIENPCLYRSEAKQALEYALLSKEREKKKRTEHERFCFFLCVSGIRFEFDFTCICSWYDNYCLFYLDICSCSRNAKRQHNCLFISNVMYATSLVFFFSHCTEMIASHIVTVLVMLWLKRHNCNSNFNFVSESSMEKLMLGLFFDFMLNLVLFHNRINESIVYNGVAVQAFRVGLPFYFLFDGMTMPREWKT